MSKESITEQQRLYLILMDLKTGLEKLKGSYKEIQEEIHRCQKFSRKTYEQTSDKYAQVVKLAEGSFLEVRNQNDLLRKQNQIHQNLTKSNEELIAKTKQQNQRLISIFGQQKLCMDRVLKANQVIVNEQLTSICKDQQKKIQQQIKQFDRQNQFIEQQKLKIQLAFEAVGNFQSRNKDLQQKLLQQKKQIDKFIEAATHKNQMLVVDLIYQKANEANQKYNNQLRCIQNIRSDFQQKNYQAINQINNIIQRSNNEIANHLNRVQNLKNETHGIKNQCQNYSIEQKKIYNNTKQEFETIKQFKNNLDRRQSEAEQKLRNMQSQTKKISQKQNDNESKYNSLDRKIKDVENNCNAVERRVKDVENKINQGSSKAQIDNLRNQLSALNNRVRSLQNQSKEDRHRSHSHKKHQH